MRPAGIDQASHLPDVSHPCEKGEDMKKDEITICSNKTCKNDLCPHSMYATPIDGTEVRLKDLFKTEDCPYSGGKGEQDNDI